MDISVVTPTHNKLSLLRRTLDSLAKQETQAKFEVVVVDDGSTDETPQFLAEFKAPYPLKVVRVEENKGRSAARNRGLEKAEGELVVFLDDDMELVPGFIEAHAALHRGSGALGGIGNVINHPEITMAPIDRYMSTRGAQKIKSEGVLPWKYFSTNNSSVKRADLEAVGGFDENFVWYGFEDLELAWRLEKERGVVLHFVEGARSLHIHPHTLQEVLDKKQLAGRSSMPYMFNKFPQTKTEMGFDKYD
ncbi:MAG: glycosyltransferase family 2 protein, partial [Candidatus Eisenbacteria bacterium]|nr:glycosyltransferase family 2 protein [Candidatus Eisenbacteria bacterium]